MFKNNNRNTSVSIVDLEQATLAGPVLNPKYRISRKYSAWGVIQQTFNCLKQQKMLIIKTPKRGHWFNTFFYCFSCWLSTGKCLLDMKFWKKLLKIAWKTMSHNPFVGKLQIVGLTLYKNNMDFLTCIFLKISKRFSETLKQWMVTFDELKK